jgi:hypothetical protein
MKYLAALCCSSLVGVYGFMFYFFARSLASQWRVIDRKARK